MKKILFIYPHADDEVLSFGGYIYDMIKEGHEVHMRCLVIGGSHRLQNRDIRFNEHYDALSTLGVDISKLQVWYENLDALMDTVPIVDIATKIDNALDTIMPDEVFCTYPSFHQDHIQLYKAFMISMRLRDGFMPSTVALGEYPFILTSLDTPSGGKLYHPLSEETFKVKCKAFECYKTQLRPKPSPLGVNGIEVLATTRGLEIGKQYSELFYLQKMII
jgi:LmbE family N-acetylglucosaminyl deacetylase